MCIKQHKIRTLLIVIRLSFIKEHIYPNKDIVKKSKEKILIRKHYNSTTYTFSRTDGTKFVLSQIGMYKGMYRYLYSEINNDGNYKISDKTIKNAIRLNGGIAPIEKAQSPVERQMAEFDNFRKRTEKEKASMYMIGAKEVVEKMDVTQGKLVLGYDVDVDLSKESQHSVPYVTDSIQYYMVQQIISDYDYLIDDKEKKIELLDKKQFV